MMFTSVSQVAAASPAMLLGIEPHTGKVSNVAAAVGTTPVAQQQLGHDDATPRSEAALYIPSSFGIINNNNNNHDNSVPCYVASHATTNADADVAQQPLNVLHGQLNALLHKQRDCPFHSIPVFDGAIDHMNTQSTAEIGIQLAEQLNQPFQPTQGLIEMSHTKDYSNTPQPLVANSTLLFDDLAAQQPGNIRRSISFNLALGALPPANPSDLQLGGTTGFSDVNTPVAEEAEPSHAGGGRMMTRSISAIRTSDTNPIYGFNGRSQRSSRENSVSVRRSATTSPFQVYQHAGDFSSTASIVSEQSSVLSLTSRFPALFIDDNNTRGSTMGSQAIILGSNNNTNGIASSSLGYKDQRARLSLAQQQHGPTGGIRAINSSRPRSHTLPAKTAQPDFSDIAPIDYLFKRSCFPESTYHVGSSPISPAYSSPSPVSAMRNQPIYGYPISSNSHGSDILQCSTDLSSSSTIMSPQMQSGLSQHSVFQQQQQQQQQQVLEQASIDSSSFMFGFPLENVNSSSMTSNSSNFVPYPSPPAKLPIQRCESKQRSMKSSDVLVNTVPPEVLYSAVISPEFPESICSKNNVPRELMVQGLKELDAELLALDMDDVTVMELKENLKRRGLAASGKKAVLMEKVAELVAVARERSGKT